MESFEWESVTRATVATGPLAAVGFVDRSTVDGDGSLRGRDRDLLDSSEGRGGGSRLGRRGGRLGVGSTSGLFKPLEKPSSLGSLGVGLISWSFGVDSGAVDVVLKFSETWRGGGLEDVCPNSRTSLVECLSENVLARAGAAEESLVVTGSTSGPKPVCLGSFLSPPVLVLVKPRNLGSVVRLGLSSLTLSSSLKLCFLGCAECNCA